MKKLEKGALKKALKKTLALCLTLAMTVSLTSCGSDASTPEGAAKSPWFRSIVVGDLNGSSTVVRPNAEPMNAYVGLAFANGDDVTVSASSDMTIDADSDKHLYAEENAHFWMEGSGEEGKSKTCIHLENGGVLATLGNKLGEEETFEVETVSSVMSVRGTTFRVKEFVMDSTKLYTLLEVFDGVVEMTNKTTKESNLYHPGECGLILSDLDGGNARFVLLDEIDSDFWNNAKTGGFTVKDGGSDTPILTIPYEKMPKDTQQYLIGLIDNGVNLVVSKETLKNVFETGHDFAVSGGTDATCLEAGSLEYTCSLCGEKMTEEVPAKGHSEVTDPAVEATCSATGLTEGSHCSVCGEVLTAQEEIPMKKHTVVIDPAVAGDCQHDGLTEGSHCSVCGAVLVAQKSVKGDHIVEERGYKAANCWTDGEQNSKYCKVCGILLEQGASIPHGHSYVQTGSSTCVTYYSCVDCGAGKTDEDHDWEPVYMGQTGGIAGYICKKCGAWQ